MKNFAINVFESHGYNLKTEKVKVLSNKVVIELFMDKDGYLQGYQFNKDGIKDSNFDTSMFLVVPKDYNDEEIEELLTNYNSFVDERLYQEGRDELDNIYEEFLKNEDEKKSKRNNYV